jgi:hypothetical protein
MKTINVVKPKYLFKKCKKCEEIKNIDEYTYIKQINNLVYTHGKCKACRVSQNRDYRKENKKNNSDEEVKCFDCDAVLDDNHKNHVCPDKPNVKK